MLGIFLDNFYGGIGIQGIGDKKGPFSLSGYGNITMKKVRSMTLHGPILPSLNILKAHGDPS